MGHPQTPSDSTVIDWRRHHVSRLKRRGVTVREIPKALAELKPPCVNPNSGEPWSTKTIEHDLGHLKTEWREAAAEDFADMKAAQLAELRELRRSAWSTQNLELVRRCLKDEREMFGTDAPLRIESTVDTREVVDRNVDEMTDDEIDAWLKVIDQVDDGGDGDET